MALPHLIATLTNISPSTASQLCSLPPAVKWLEVRADLVGDPDPDWLRARFPGQLLYALRSGRQSGAGLDPIEQRHRRLTKAAGTYDRVEIEAETDLAPSLVDQIPFRKRLAAWYGNGDKSSSLSDGFAQLSSLPAARYKLVTNPTTIAGELNCLCFLKQLGRSDVVVYSDGGLGFWTRIVGLQLGSPAIYGLVHNDKKNSDQPSTS